MIDSKIPLLAAGSVDLTNAINSGFNSYYRAQQNNRQNALLDLQSKAQESSLNRQNALLDIAQKEDQRKAELHDFNIGQAKGGQIYKALQGLRGLSPEIRTKGIDALAQELGPLGFDDDDRKLLATDEGLEQAIQLMGRYVTPMSAQERLRTQELGIKKDRLEFDKEQAEKRLNALNNTVDSLDVPEEDKKTLKALPASSLEKILQKQLDPKTKADEADRQKEKQQAQQGAQEILELATSLKNHKGRERATGFSSMFPSIAGGDARDFEVKLERLSSLLTLDNLGLMSGVLTDKDIQILRSAAGGLDVGQSEEALLGELDRIIENVSDGLKGSGSESKQADQEKYSLGQIIEHNGQRFRVTGGDMNDPDVELVQ